MVHEKVQTEEDKRLLERKTAFHLSKQRAVRILDAAATRKSISRGYPPFPTMTRQQVVPDPDDAPVRRVDGNDLSLSRRSPKYHKTLTATPGTGLGHRWSPAKPNSIPAR